MNDRLRILIIIMISLFGICALLNIPKSAKQQKIPVSSNSIDHDINYTPPSIWSIRHYVDNFGDPITKGYIFSGAISGKFSNSATTDSRLIADLLIDRSDKIAFQLYEYGDNNPTKGYHPDGEYFDIFVKDDQGLKSAFIGILDQGSDRIRFISPDDARKFHKALMNNNEIKVFIQNDDTPTSNYSFTIQARNYKEIYKEFSKNK